jgi:hypothetical protein
MNIINGLGAAATWSMTQVSSLGNNTISAWNTVVGSTAAIKTGSAVASAAGKAGSAAVWTASKTATVAVAVWNSLTVAGGFVAAKTVVASSFVAAKGAAGCAVVAANPITAAVVVVASAVLIGAVVYKGIQAWSKPTSGKAPLLLRNATEEELQDLKVHAYVRAAVSLRA